MPLSKQEVDGLMRVVSRAQDDEINCEQCLAAVAEFAEQQLAGNSIAAGLRAVEHHLSICDECREEYQVLLKSLDTLEGNTDG